MVVWSAARLPLGWLADQPSNTPILAELHSPPATPDRSFWSGVLATIWVWLMDGPSARK